MLLPRSDYDDPEELRQIVARFRELVSELEHRELQIRRGEVGSIYFLSKVLSLPATAGPSGLQLLKLLSII